MLWILLVCMGTVQDPCMKVLKEEVRSSSECIITAAIVAENVASKGGITQALCLPILSEV